MGKILWNCVCDVIGSYYARMWENFGDMLTTASKIRDDPHCLDYNHYAPIHYAAKFGHMICVKLLLDYKCPVDSVTHAGKTALHIACEFQHKSVVELLIRYNANLNQKTFKSGDFPLLIAARNGNTEIVSKKDLQFNFHTFSPCPQFPSVFFLFVSGRDKRPPRGFLGSSFCAK